MKRVGGVYFFRVGRVSGSVCLTRRRPPVSFREVAASWTVCDRALACEIAALALWWIV